MLTETFDTFKQSISFSVQSKGAYSKIQKRHYYFILLWHLHFTCPDQGINCIFKPSSCMTRSHCPHKSLSYFNWKINAHCCVHNPTHTTLHTPNPTDNFIIVPDCSCLFRWFLGVFWVKSTKSSLALCNLGLYAPLVCFLARTRALLFEAISLQMVIRAGCNGKSCTANATVHVQLPFSKQSTYPGYPVFFHCRKRNECSWLRVFIPFIIHSCRWF